MDNQNNKLLLVVVGITGVLLVVAISSKRDSSPFMREVMNGQSETIQTLRQIEQNLSGQPAIDAAGKPSAQSESGAVLMTLQDLQKRVTALETKLEMMLSAGPLAGGNRPAQPGPGQEDFTKVHDITVTHSPVRGNKDAPVTIVEFVDFQCPFCARFHPPIKEVLSAYPNDVRYIIKNFPLSFHPQARPAAKAAFAAGEQGKYWEMADLILENNTDLSDGKYKELAKQLGLDVNKFTKDLKDKDAQWEEWLDADVALAAQIDVRGTPTFFVNGRKSVARNFAQYKAEIDKILSEKK